MADNVIDAGTKQTIATRSDIFVIAGGLTVAVFWVWPRIQLLISRPTEEGLLYPAAVPFSYLNLALFLVYAGSLLRFAHKPGPAKFIHLVLLLIMALFVLVDDVEFIVHYLIPTSETDDQLLRSPAMWWGLSDGIRWLLWFAFNVWYFIRRPEKAKG